MAETLKKAARPAEHVAPLRAKKKNEDPTVRTYRVLVPMQVADEDGICHKRQFGDFVPEADTWKNTGLYLRTQQIEIAFVNKSELDAWREEYTQRCEEEDAAKVEAEADEQRELELRRELLALEKKKANAEKKRDFNMGHGGRNSFQPEPVIQEKIDFGSVKSRGGIPRPAEMPSVPTREVPQQKNVSENRNRPTTVRRITVKKKG
jgi:hypothetical protein